MPPSGTMTQDMLFLESGGGIVPGQDVTLIWFEFDSPVDLNSGLAINEGVVFARPDVPYWMSDFAGDTWEGGYLMPTVTYNPDPFALTAFRFDGSGFATQDFPGFVYRNGSMMFVGVDSGFLAADGPLDELGYAAPAGAAAPRRLRGTARGGFSEPRTDDDAWMERVLRRARPDLTN